MAIGRFVGGIFGNGPAQQQAQVVSSVDPVEQELAQMSVSLEKLRSAVRRSGSTLPTLLSSQLGQLCDLLGVVYQDLKIRGGSTEQRVLLNAMICSYIPEPLQAFLSLPAAYQSDSSKSAGMLEEQLATLFETLADLHNQIRIGAVEELSTHGRFLADKFAGQDAALQLEQHPELYPTVEQNHSAPHMQAAQQQAPQIQAPQPVERDPLRLEGQSWRQ